ncbi:MAG: hypothetical protein IKF80_02795 [Erysipelotrichaceae bacterium]|nr:hypothetical protein [Erysipelotrichaceae bacterium]
MCEKKVVGYESISASCIGYGKTKADALEDCEHRIWMLQSEFNPKNDSFKKTKPARD